MSGSTIADDTDRDRTEEQGSELLIPRKGDDRTQVEAGCVVDQTERLERLLQEQVVGQEQAIDQLVAPRPDFSPVSGTRIALC